jgi:hypothetical protein
MNFASSRSTRDSRFTSLEESRPLHVLLTDTLLLFCCVYNHNISEDGPRWTLKSDQRNRIHTSILQPDLDLQPRGYSQFLNLSFSTTLKLERSTKTMDQINAVRILDTRDDYHHRDNLLNQNCLLFKDVAFMLTPMKHALPPVPSSAVSALSCTAEDDEDVLLPRSVHTDIDLWCSSYTDSSSSSSSSDDDSSDDDDDVSATRRKRRIPSFRRYSRSICVKRSGMLAGTIFIPSVNTKTITKSFARTSPSHGPRLARRSTRIGSITTAGNTMATTRKHTDDCSCISDMSWFDDLDADTEKRQQP